MKDINPSHLDEIISEIKKLQDKIEEHVDWNFGRAPNEIWFDTLVNERNELLKTLMQLDYRKYSNLCDELFGG